MSSRSSSRKPDTRGDRVQKVLASTGLASRREIDRLIQAGRVLIDGRTAEPGERLLGHEVVLVDGKRVRLPQMTARAHSVISYHKPTGEVTSRADPEGRSTVFSSLPKIREGRWIAIGRLDINTSGLLLFTTDGDLAHRLMHPSFEIQRAYAVRVRGTLSDEHVEVLTEGVALEDGVARFEYIQPMNEGTANSWYEVGLREGKNREVRRLFEAVGMAVSRLMRIRYGPIQLGRMTRGSCRYLDDAETRQLYSAVGLDGAAVDS